MRGRTKSHFIIGLLGLSAVIIIHEMGHFIACKIFGIHTPLFSLGFGPRLVAFTPWKTTFQLALLPLGGYVTMDQVDFAARSYLVKMIVIGAGIICNIVFACGVLCHLLYKSRLTIDVRYNNTHTHTILPDVCNIGDDMRICSPTEDDEEFRSVVMDVNHFHNTMSGSDGDTPRERIKLLQSTTNQLFRSYGFQGLIGPIGLMSVIGTSVSYGRDFFLFILAMLSFNIGIFNVLPIPGLDGSQLVAVTIEKIAGSYASTADVMQTLFLIILLIFIACITLRDIARITKRN